MRILRLPQICPRGNWGWVQAPGVERVLRVVPAHASSSLRTTGWAQLRALQGSKVRQAGRQQKILRKPSWFGQHAACSSAVTEGTMMAEALCGSQGQRAILPSTEMEPRPTSSCLSHIVLWAVSRAGRKTGPEAGIGGTLRTKPSDQLSGKPAAKPHGAAGGLQRPRNQRGANRWERLPQRRCILKLKPQIKPLIPLLL